MRFMLRREDNATARARGYGCPAAMICLLALAQVAAADDEPVAAAVVASDVRIESLPALSTSLAVPDASIMGLSGAFLPTGELFAQGSEADAPAHELAAGLNVQVTKSRRKFRTRAVNWMTDRSVAMGVVTDFLLGGGDSGWHLVADVTGTDEYVLEWKAKFR